MCMVCCGGRVLSDVLALTSVTGDTQCVLYDM